MRIYVGSTRKRSFVEMLADNDIGRVNHPSSIFRPYDGERWFADNGAYSCWLQGKPFDANKYLAFLEKTSGFETQPDFGVLPDIVADGLRSLDYSLEWLNSAKLPPWRWYLALQDGMSVADVEGCLGYVDGLFIGGTIRFKASAWIWVKLSNDAGLPIHFGRAGVHHRLHEAASLGCSSADSAFPLWTMDRMARFISWMKNGHYDEETYKQLFLPFPRSEKPIVPNRPVV